MLFHTPFVTNKAKHVLDRQGGISSDINSVAISEFPNQLTGN